MEQREAQLRSSPSHPAVRGDRLEPEHGIRLRRLRKRDFKREIRAFMEVYNRAWSNNWGFVPLTDAELDHLAKELKPALDEDFAGVAETAGGIRFSVGASTGPKRAGSSRSTTR